MLSQAHTVEMKGYSNSCGNKWDPCYIYYQDVFKYKALTSVVIEEGITRIHARAFKDNELTEIILPNA